MQVENLPGNAMTPSLKSVAKVTSKAGKNLDLFVLLKDVLDMIDSIACQKASIESTFSFLTRQKVLQLFQ